MALLHLQPRLDGEELLRHARLEWSVETMHWLLESGNILSVLTANED